MTNKVKKLTNVDFAQNFADTLSEFVKNKISQYDFSYTIPTNKERDEYIRRAIDVLLDKNLIYSGKHRKNDWEKGWQENLDAYLNTKAVADISPKYFGKYNCIRWRQDYIKPVNSLFEANTLAVICYYLFDKYLRKVRAIYEFGCGTGHNLLKAREINQEAELWGLDWASSSQNLIENMRQSKVDDNIYGENFDYFHPNQQFNLKPYNGVFTVASLEQIGTKFRPFIDYLLEKSPEICIHIEPINELLDPSNLLDYLSIRYFEKRNYLWGLVDYLRNLEKLGKIKIIEAKRSYIGSMFIDGYSIIVWKPIK